MKKLLFSLAILVPAIAAATPPQGVELKLHRGFFTETNIGAFFTLGGNDRYSNAQTYLQLGVGYDLSDKLELGVGFGLGTNAANCFSGRTGPLCSTTDNFTVMFLNGSLAYNIKLAERFYMAPKVSAGWAMLDPAPVRSSDGREIKNAPNLGAGVGIEYLTAMEHFSVGLDVQARYILRANIPGIAVFPRVKYTF
jgi:hypothetical protein